MAIRVRQWVLISLLLPLLGGCVPKQVVMEEPPLQSASLEELVELQRERARTIQTVRALLTVHPQGERSFTASLKFIRDAGSGSPGLQVRGFDPLGRTVFEFNFANGSFRIRVSRNGQMADLGPGDPEITKLPVSPSGFLQMAAALVGPVMDPGETPVLEARGRFYLIHLVRVTGKGGVLSKRLWINREDLALARVEFFSAGREANGDYDIVPRIGIDLKENQLRETGGKGRISWPRRVNVGSMFSEADGIPGVKLEFKEVHFNEGSQNRDPASLSSQESVK